jgi:hypothetical protein
MAKKKTNTEQPKKAPEPIIEYIDVQHDFSITEIGEIARRSALANQRVLELEEKKKQVTKDYAAQIEEAQATVNMLSQKISNGYEMRSTECVVTLDPKNSSKDYHVKKTGAFARREEMTQADFQLSMKFEKEQEAEAKKAAADAGKVNVGEAIEKTIISSVEAVPGELMQTPDKWAELDERRIVNAKGWHGRYMKAFDLPITFAEYETRVALSDTAPRSSNPDDLGTTPETQQPAEEAVPA